MNLVERVDQLDQVVKNQQDCINELACRMERLKEELSTKVSSLPKDAQEKIERLKKAAEGIVDG